MSNATKDIDQMLDQIDPLLKEEYEKDPSVVILGMLPLLGRLILQRLDNIEQGIDELILQGDKNDPCSVGLGR
jgi:hypothetical protein